MEKLIFAVLAIGVLISVHEFGHFVLAKAVGIRVLRFSIGFGPEIFSFTLGETRYCVSAFPLGGYVKLYGETPDEEVDEPEKSFSHRPPKDRAGVVIGGPLFNVLFAFFAFCVTALFGIPKLLPIVGSVEKGGPAQISGVKSGDRIVEINGRKVRYWNDISKFMEESHGKPVTLKLERDGKFVELTVKPELRVFRDPLFGEKKRWIIGIMALGKYKIEKIPLWKAPYEAFKETVDVCYVTIVGIYRIITGAISPKAIGGPLMIMKMAGEEASLGFVSFLYFLAVISVNLGIINLFPIPILDGWHLLILSVEGVTGKPVSKEKNLMAQKIGIVILILIMAFAFYNDIVRIFFANR